jgi:hypothetical protein
MGVLATPIVAVAALTTGVLRPSDDTRLLIKQVEQQVRSCVQDAGHDSPEVGAPLGELKSESGRPNAYEACWSGVVRDPKYSPLKISTSSEAMDEARAYAFRLWRCVELAGFRRATPIPLSAPDGYPLMPASRHFAVSRSQPQLGAFYGTVARCGNLPLSGFKGPDGMFADVTAGGESCKRDRRSINSHSRGCFSVNAYPEGF